MSTFRSAASRAWTLSAATVRFIARVLIGLLGVYWLVGGTAGVIVAATQLALLSLAGPCLLAFIGWHLAHGAFHHWPWEAFPHPGRHNVRDTIPE